MNSIKDISLLQLMPSSIANDVTVRNLCKAIDGEVTKLNLAIDKLCILPNISQLDNNLLDILASQSDAPYYDVNLSLKQKREIVKNSINWHKKKGTVAAVEEVVSIIFGESSVEEWYQYGGEPHHFRIITTNINVNDDFINRFKSAAEHIKRKSSWLDDVIVLIASELKMYVGFALHTGETITIRQEG